MNSSHDYDVLIVGGGPAGSTAATCLARAGLRVACFERERFPRFHVGESLLPANIPLFERLGVHDAIKKAGFLLKWGANVADEQEGGAYGFAFMRKGQRDFGYEVPRAEFDTILLRHAEAQGANVFQETSVESAQITADGVAVTVRPRSGEVRTVKGAFLMDASGRDAFLAGVVGRRERIPNLGKVALYAHFAGAQRFPGLEEGNIRITVFDGGWFWWIPFTGEITSVGCVLHARTVRERSGSVEDLFDAMVARCRAVADGVAGARRVSPVYRSANFSYRTSPVVGDRFLRMGDAVAFVDPIFSAGVFIAMQSAEIGSSAVIAAFRDGDFRARRFRRYERAVRRGMAPFFALMEKYYQPAFLEIFVHPTQRFGLLEAVTTVLAGWGFLSQPLSLRLRLATVFAVAHVNRWVRRWQGRPVESRLEW
jgi:flavin-dependent dehydrogenase